MDNNNENSLENQSAEQPQPIYESISSDSMQPEEVGSDVSNPDDVLSAIPSDLPPDQSFYADNGGGGGGNKSRFLIIGGSVALFILVLAGILVFIFRGGGGKGGGGSNEPEKEITLTYWGLWEDEQVYKGVIEEFQKKNPKIKIKYEKRDPRDYREKLIARSQNKVGPDIFRFHNTWVPEIREVLSPLPETVMTNADFEKTFYPVHARDLKVGNYYYGIPLTIDGLVLLYNADILRAAGYDKPPALWDNLIEMLDDIIVKDDKNNIQTSPLAIGTANNVEHYSDIYGLMYLQNILGLKSTEPAKMTRVQVWDTLRDFDTPAGVSVLQIYREQAEVPYEYWNTALPNSLEAFLAKRVAMIIVPSWQVLTIKSIDPDFPVKVAPVPQIPQQGNPNYVALSSYWVEGVSSASPNQVYAWQFLKYLSEKETMQKLYEAQRNTRLFGEPYSRRDLADKLENDPYIGPVIQQADYYYSIPLNSRTYDGGEDKAGGINDDIIKYLENAINGTVQGQAYSQAAQEAKNGIVQVLDKYKIEE